MELNIKKTEIMAPTTSSTEIIKFIVKELKLEQVKEYKYLDHGNK